MSKDDLRLDLPNFEGPLDLLLHLIQSQKIDIYDIPIAKITKQYLQYLQEMQRLNLQIAGEFFVMSSTLLRIKSQYLLPQNDFDPYQAENDDPREELVQQLVQYSVFKKVSSYLKEREANTPTLMAKEPSIEKAAKVEKLPKGEISEENLTESFKQVLRRLKLRKPNIATLNVAETPITQMLNYLQAKLKEAKAVSFFACARTMNDISDVIGLFLAILEMCKDQQVKVKQIDEFSDLIVERI
ncbi:segregation and condensation protein A [Lactobacillus corticis]|uniref:Segregation and condensation protein A n=1 Tax=Lactobacillus corticis TaxID=2201249 RepID=A0A916QJU6_9LACO|nr:segregation/condensation protein A [Lactobacillus corticis]GFZ26973.1 segregation and condensation protein ScpA [Lactobacillus corticis]